MTYTIDQIDQIANNLISDYQGVKIFTLSGDLGAGKTTLSKHLLKNLGVTDTITSPTFSYVNVYEVQGKKIYHFDLYRLNSLEDFYQMGFEDYLYQNDSVVLIEWPSIVKSLITEASCHIFLENVDQITRKLAVREAL